MSIYAPQTWYTPPEWAPRERTKYLPSIDITTPTGQQAATLLGIYNVMPKLGAGGAQYAAMMLGPNAAAMRSLVPSSYRDPIYKAFQAAGAYSPPSSAYALGKSGIEALGAARGLGSLSRWLGGEYGPTAMNDYLNTVVELFNSGKYAPVTADEWREFNRIRQLALGIQPGPEVPGELVGLVEQALFPELLATPVTFSRAPRTVSLGNWWR